MCSFFLSAIAPNSNRSIQRYKDIYITLNDEEKRSIELYSRRMHDILSQASEHDFAPNGGIDQGQSKKAIDGHLLEYAVLETLLMQTVKPLYRQAELLHCPLSKFDVLLYDPVSPVVLSVKKSLAERWRQAAFEGESLKRVYHGAELYLITLDEKGASKRNDEIHDKVINGIDRIILFGSDEYVSLIEQLSTRAFSVAQSVDPIVKKHSLLL